MSGALLARSRSRSLPASLSRSPPRSLLLSFRGLISLAKALAPDHWLLLKENNYVTHGMELIPQKSNTALQPLLYTTARGGSSIQMIY